ncbi:transglycosylase SLT domain-containing protein [uncultured Thiodictyon sp.]|uniref:transglycosylase SLT domain-containing protein n=1 Tax=uncultured Thiodictyon sp. TaxID=1846217 RepID=UPI0025D16D49|nr:transglycosylase SLT domain-containing protein [uncultured Thiodictyon sp.]
MLRCTAITLKPALLALALLLGATARAQEPDLAGFLNAEAALKAGDRAAFTALLEGLRVDPLYPYLRFADLDLKSAPDATLAGFLAEFPDTPQAERVRAAAVQRLAAAGRWADLARLYREDDDSIERRCLYLRALIETGRAERALTPVRLEPLWLVGHPQPAACDPVFAAWRAQGGLDSVLLWQRIRLALAAGETGLARRLGTDLPAAERPRLDRWLAVRARPALVLEPDPTPAADPLAAAILADGIARLARTNPQGAASALRTGRALLATDPAAADLALAAVGRALTAAGDPTGLAIWDGMSAGADNLAAQERRLRAAIAQEDWSWVAAWVGRMPDSAEKRDRWLYWLGRAQSALGDEAAARVTLTQAAAERSLWGLLAADRLGLPYALEQQPVPAEPERIRRLAAAPALLRIRLLRLLGREADMRREWRTLTRSLERPDLLAAAYVADALRWHDQAIYTLVRTGYWDDLELRFPLAYRDQVQAQAAASGLPPDWVYGVIRQESVFNPTVASPVGALGLMQLMPATARQVAADLGLPPPTRAAILDPALNVQLGSHYLAQLRDRLGHAALATAAYNAGPQRVARWLPAQCMAADRWIAAIPFDETRGYVERVLAYRIIYGARLGLPPQRLSDLLPPVCAKAAP